MSKFNHSSVRARGGVSAVSVDETPSGFTFEGGAGFARDEKSELFLAAVSDFANEGSFYESANNRSRRINTLVRKVAVADPEWVKNFVTWLRNEANMRSISLVIALEAAKGMLEANVPGARAIVSSAIRRADEPGEALGYWFANYGRKLPAPVKRGIADAVVKTYSQYSLAKYDTPSHSFRFGDVIELVHPSPKDVEQSNLFKYALDRRRNSDASAEGLDMLWNRALFMDMSTDQKLEAIRSGNGSEILSNAGLTWEAVSGSAGKLDAKGWEALIPSMGYMALLRNLRNFVAAGVSQKVLETVLDRLSNEEQVAKSRQLPFRFLSAYRANSTNLKIGAALEDALGHSLANVPALKGKTLILVDCSGSMYWSQSKNTDLSFADTAAIFGTTLALRAEKADLVMYGNRSEKIPFRKGDSVLPVLKRFHDMGGTSTRKAVADNLNGHDRVILITDEQATSGNVFSSVPKGVPTYTWNLVGYRYSSSPSGANRHFFGGLSDQSFKLIPLLERGIDTGWPWEV